MSLKRVVETTLEIGDVQEKKVHWMGTVPIFLFLLALIAGALYLNTLSHSFVWDDHTYVLGNPQFQDSQYFPHYFVSDFCEGVNEDCFFYRPLVSLTYLLDQLFWGGNPFGYHLTNIVIHILVSLLVFAVLGTLLQNKMAAWIGAILFAIHPIHSESVSFIAARTDPPATLFYLLAFFFYLKTSHCKGIQGFMVQAVSLLCFSLALATKEIAVTLPLVLMIHSLLFPTPNRSIGGLWKRLGASVPYWLVLLAYFLLRKQIFGDPLGENSLLEGLGQRLFTLPLMFLNNLRMLIFPWPLEVFREPVDQRGLMDPLMWGAIPLFLFLGWVTFYFFKKAKETQFALAWVFITLLPVLNIIPSPWASVWDRFLYLPSVGLSIWVASLCSLFLSMKGSEGSNFLRWGLGVFGMIALLVLSAVTVDRNRDWKNNATFWGVTFRQVPEGGRSWAVSGNNLAEALRERGEMDKAIQVLEEIHKVRPGFLAARINLGNAYAEFGKPQEALRVYETLLAETEGGVIAVNNANKSHSLKQKIKITSNKFFYNLGVTYSKLGEGDKAHKSFQRSIALNPKNHLAHNALGNLYSKEDQLEQAEKAYVESIRLRPDFGLGYQNLAQLYIRKGNWEQAMNTYLSALAVKPRNRKTYQNLGGIYFQQGMFQKAFKLFEEGIRWFPEDASLHYNVGLVHQKLGRLGPALKAYKQALRIEPDNPEIHNNLGVLREIQGDSPGALGAYQQAVSLYPNFIMAQINVGRMLVETGKPQKALKTFESVLERIQHMDQESPEAQFLLAQIRLLEAKKMMGGVPQGGSH